MAILSNGCKPDNFESHNSLKLSFTNIRGLRSTFVDCESFLESNSPVILALCKTNLDDSIGSGIFSSRGYLPLIRKGSTSHMHGLAIYLKEGLPFSRDLSLENSAVSYFCFRLPLLHSMPYFFFLYRSPSSSLSTVCDFISFNIDEVLSISPPANMFVFGDFKVHHKNWLTYSGGTDTPGKLCYNFSISNGLTQMVNFSTRIPFLLMLVFVLQWLSIHWVTLIMLCFSFYWFSVKFTTGFPVSSHSLWLFSCCLGRPSWSLERCSMGGYL